MSGAIAGRVSIVTPTHERHAFLTRLRSFVLGQTHEDLEWVILDDSASPHPGFGQTDDDRIIYEHIPHGLSLGEKRNRLVARASGEFIVQFDDDDYYSPTYVATMISLLTEHGADIMNLRGWYLFDVRSDFFGYWDLSKKDGHHFCCDIDGVRGVVFDASQLEALRGNEFGYGFSYAFRRSVWEHVKFSPIGLGEDSTFLQKAMRDFKYIGMRDGGGLCLHILHPRSTSRCFPQYRFPKFLINRFFPEIAYAVT